MNSARFAYRHGIKPAGFLTRGRTECGKVCYRH